MAGLLTARQLRGLGIPENVAIPAEALSPELSSQLGVGHLVEDVTPADELLVRAWTP